MSNNLLFQVYSDTHIELWNKIPVLPINAKYLILAGNIGQVKHPLFFPFLDYCSVHWEKTFYVPGNCEYYSKKQSMDELEFEYSYKIGEKYKNVYYLNNTFVPLDENINIYGTTFWTIPPFSSKTDAKMYINDYNYITYNKTDATKTVNVNAELDTSYVKYVANNSFHLLNKYLNEENKKTIIVTHFPPTSQGTINPTCTKITQKYIAWDDNVLEKLNVTNVVAWVSGHTHWSYDIRENNIRLISNQMGFNDEIGLTGIKESGLYEIEYNV